MYCTPACRRNKIIRMHFLQKLFSPSIPDSCNFIMLLFDKSKDKYNFFVSRWCATQIYEKERKEEDGDCLPQSRNRIEVAQEIWNWIDKFNKESEKRNAYVRLISSFISILKSISDIYLIRKIQPFLQWDKYFFVPITLILWQTRYYVKWHHDSSEPPSNSLQICSLNTHSKYQIICELCAGSNWDR